MTGRLDDLPFVLEDLLSDFDLIRQSSLSNEEKLSEMASHLQSRMNLYYVRVLRFEGEWAVLNSIFGNNQEDIQYYINTEHSHSNSKKWEIEKVFPEYKTVSTAKIRANFMQATIHRMFAWESLPMTTSWVLVPIIESGKVIGIMDAASDEVFEKTWRTDHDSSIIRSLTLPFEMLAMKITEVLESKSH